MNELVKLTFARKALAEAKTLNELKEIKDIAKAVKAYTIAKGLGVEMVNEASEIEIRAIREMGKLIQEGQDNGEIATQEMGGTGSNQFGSVPDRNTSIKTLPQIGITRKESSTSKKLSSIPDEKFEDIIRGAIENKKHLTKTFVLRDISKNEVNTDTQISNDTYRIIYADPPWQYSDRKEYRPEGSAENHYPTMSIAELSEMKIPKTEENAVLFIWVTSPFLEDVFKIINAWGFKYKASFIWDKIKHNMGHYNSVRHEFLLIATKGSCMPDEKILIDSVQSIERSDVHSEKPEQFYEIIEKLYTHGKKYELFGRKIRNGWDVYGNQL